MTLDEIKDKIAMEKYNTHWLGMDSHARASLVDEVARQYADSKVKNLAQPDVSGQLQQEEDDDIDDFWCDEEDKREVGL